LDYLGPDCRKTNVFDLYSVKQKYAFSDCAGDPPDQTNIHWLLYVIIKQ